MSDVLETNAGKLGTLLCRDAIESRAPFGVWTQQMVDQLGEETYDHCSFHLSLNCVRILMTPVTIRLN
jgi:hypothetical protein